MERGDTLWDLADRFLDDPFLWQRIWKANQDQIEDPDLIFPGERFAIPGMEGMAGARARAGERERRQQAGEQEREQARDPGERRAEDEAAGDTAAGARASLFETGRRGEGVASGGFTAEERPALRPLSWDGVVGAPFLARRGEMGTRGRVLGPATAGSRRMEAWQGRTDDEVRVALRGLDVSAGDTLFTVQFGRSLVGRGRVVQPTGILSVQVVRSDTALARVSRVYGLVREDDPVVRFPVPEVPEDTDFRPADRDLEATVLETSDGSALLREGGLVFLDSGSSDGVRTGDLFRAAPAESSAEQTGRNGVRAIVVRVRPGSSTARVVYPGDGTVSQGATARLVSRLAAPGR